MQDSLKKHKITEPLNDEENFESCLSCDNDCADLSYAADPVYRYLETTVKARICQSFVLELNIKELEINFYFVPNF